MDLEEVAGFENALRSNRRFFARTFTRGEIGYANSKAGSARHFAGTFAAKEAVIKAVSQVAKDAVRLSDVGIIRSRTGAPVVKWIGDKPRGVQVRISISHTTHYAVAVALAMVRD